MSIQVKNIEDVVNYQLCTGCGACAAVEPERYQIHDIEHVGRRPKIKSKVDSSGLAYQVCPGHHLQHELGENSDSFDQELLSGWGPVLEVWEGYAADDTVRYKGSSGGAATALANYALSLDSVTGVLHTGKDAERPYLNKAIYSESSEELIGNAGSRYATASPCERLAEIEKKKGQSVVIGKPCDIAAVDKLEKVSASFASKLALKIGFFCAGVPSTKGNIALLEKQGVEVGKLVDLKYRGEGWPGMWRATSENSKGETQVEMTYAESWGFLQKYRQWRCYICPDHTGEFADLAVGDPWYRKIEEGEAGKSLIIVRSERGRKFLQQAVSAGFIVLESKESSLLPRSQPNLMKTRGNLWARLLVLKWTGSAVPVFAGFNTFKFWLDELSFKEKIQSFLGTFKRVKSKSLNKNQKHV
ncbi:coenzyme F420 hydrogenase subunit beta [Alteromonadaceae bacterium Bs31]|nr:coenzyme F420 hydrogenase subunit beta [Alteromonadaceae bacterium Bs31]